MTTTSAPAKPGPRVLVLAQEAPIPVEVICAWLRKKAAAGVPIRISSLLAQRIAAELAEVAGRTVGKQGAKMPAGDRSEFGAADERASGREGANPSPSPAASPVVTRNA